MQLYGVVVIYYNTFIVLEKTVYFNRLECHELYITDIHSFPCLDHSIFLVNSTACYIQKEQAHKKQRIVERQNYKHFYKVCL